MKSGWKKIVTFNKMQENKKHGGARKGTGPKLKFGEPTVSFGVRVPKSKALEIKERINLILEEYVGTK